VKNWQKAISIEKKSDIISRLARDERIVDIYCIITLNHISIHTIHGNTERIKENAKCLDKVKCQQSEMGSVCVCSKTTRDISE
jgi:hypothetical protein